VPGRAQADTGRSTDNDDMLGPAFSFFGDGAWATVFTVRSRDTEVVVVVTGPDGAGTLSH
jgi:hypothetical protein